MSARRPRAGETVTVAPWIMPDWMIPLLPLVGGADSREWIEELVNDRETAVQVNAPRALMCVSVKAQIGLLTRLHDRGLLK